MLRSDKQLRRDIAAPIRSIACFWMWYRLQLPPKTTIVMPFSQHRIVLKSEAVIIKTSSRHLPNQANVVHALLLILWDHDCQDHVKTKLEHPLELA